MFGCSIFLNEEIDFDYLKMMKKSGFEGIFTSIHIPEDDDSVYINRIKTLGKFVRENHLTLMVDVSGNTLEKIGASFMNVQPLLDIGITGLRIDYGISNQTIADLSHKMDIALNASTIGKEDIEELSYLKANFSNIEAWHNYYPRPKTGLDEYQFHKKNAWLHHQGLKVMAFVPGNSKKRGPLYKGLPTIEKHRNLHPLVASVELINQYHVDHVYIGDPGISTLLQRQFQNFILNNKILLRADKLVDNDEKLLAHIAGEHTNRKDAARDVIRSEESRLIRKISAVPKMNTIPRLKGSITIDNEAYGRYMGEVQITKVNLSQDEKVNVIAKVSEEDLLLIDIIEPGQKFEFLLEDGYGFGKINHGATEP
ncbi:DUF871 domain-containing protein [Aerococcus agrisoli]|uniref:DUF871 domain-containing protein n=1 Tax=Aerococcus agrisoli TaxID=2487350 RepID=A0A3N4G8Q7_9LACT|nr:MupG family TIM beta-alpha barrel fold protein [Aerococcus agrisoli]RPA59112.1 DUF871 domain-containing protein [Aerococcus agrisoli]